MGVTIPKDSEIYRLLEFAVSSKSLCLKMSQPRARGGVSGAPHDKRGGYWVEFFVLPKITGVDRTHAPKNQWSGKPSGPYASLKKSKNHRSGPYVSLTKLPKWTARIHHSGPHAPLKKSPEWTSRIESKNARVDLTHGRSGPHALS